MNSKQKFNIGDLVEWHQTLAGGKNWHGIVIPFSEVMQRAIKSRKVDGYEYVCVRWQDGATVMERKDLISVIAKAK